MTSRDPGGRETPGGPAGDTRSALLDASADDRWLGLYVTALGTGLRQGELLALRWTDPATDAAQIGWARDLYAAMAPWETDSAYVIRRFGTDAMLP